LDPITHIFFGAALGRSGFNRKAALATATMAIAAELPDIDITLQLFDPVTAFQHHRGATHTILGAPVMAALATGIMYGWYRWQTRDEDRKARWHARNERYGAPLRWGLLYCFAVIAALSHILLDITNNYGVRPFMPFNYRWYAWDIVNIFEPAVTLPLMLAFVFPWLFGMIGSEVGEKRPRFRGRGSAIAAIVIVALVWWGRDYHHRRALALLERARYQDSETLRFSANPYALTPFRWHGVVETPTAFNLVQVDTMKEQVDPEEDARVFYKPEETPATIAAKKSRLGKAYLDWARYPYTETEVLYPPQGGYEVRFRDLRYAYPEMSHAVLACSVTLDSKLNVVDEGFNRAEESIWKRIGRLFIIRGKS
jgi:inner membrane protein